MHSFQVVLNRNIREISEIRGRYIHAKVVYIICFLEVRGSLQAKRHFVPSERLDVRLFTICLFGLLSV